MTPTLRTWLIAAAAWVVYTIPEALQFSTPGIDPEPGATFVECLQQQLPRALFLWTPLTVALLAVARRFPLTQGPWLNRMRQLAGVILAALTFRTLAERLLRELDYYLVPALYETPGPFFDHFLLKFLGYQQKVLLVVCFCYAWEHVRAERENRVRIAELEMRVARARLDALAAQLNPGFLFDTLRNIARLAHADADSADRMLTTFSSLLRFSLAHRDDTIEVKDEIELARQYLAIESIRLDGRLDVRWSVDDAVAEAHVPALIVQSLVEHLVPRDIAPGPVSLNIALRGQDGVLLLDVAHAGTAPLPQGRLDLADVRARLDGLYGARSTLVSDIGSVHVTLPQG